MNFFSIISLFFWHNRAQDAKINLLSVKFRNQEAESCIKFEKNSSLDFGGFLSNLEIELSEGLLEVRLSVSFDLYEGLGELSLDI